MENAGEVLPLKEWRLRRYMSHRKLAQLAKVSTETLIRGERGGRLYEVTQRKIADALGVTPGQILEFTQADRASSS